MNLKQAQNKAAPHTANAAGITSLDPAQTLTTVRFNAINLASQCAVLTGRTHILANDDHFSS